MHDDPNATARYQPLEAARSRLRDSQREDLLAAARSLIPDLGIAVNLGRVAAVAGLSPYVARGLFNSSADVALLLVRRAWLALIERTAPCVGGTAEAFVAGLIAAIRDDAAAHRIRNGLACGVPQWMSNALDEADAALAFALTESWRSLHPGIDHPAAAGLGGLLLALARDVALAPTLSDRVLSARALSDGVRSSDDRVEAARITAMLLPAALPPPATLPAPQPARPARVRPVLTLVLPEAAPATRPTDPVAPSATSRPGDEAFIRHRDAAARPRRHRARPRRGHEPPIQ